MVEASVAKLVVWLCVMCVGRLIVLFSLCVHLTFFVIY